MQKQVSKQSLAVLALSILLAISMALTATFAAFSQSKTVTGSITFVNGLTITLAQTQTSATAGVTLAGAEGDSPVAFSITLASTAFEIGTVGEDEAAYEAFVLTSAAKAELAKMTVQIKNESDTQTAYWSIKIDKSLTNCTMAGNGETGNGVSTGTEGNNGVLRIANFRDILGEIVVTDTIATGSPATFTVTIKANYDQSKVDTLA